MVDRKRLREMGVPEDMTADDVKALFSLPDDDDSMHQQWYTNPELKEHGMSLQPVALTMLKATAIAWPDPVTIEPKDSTDEIALKQLRNAEYVELWDMHQNGDRRWMITKLGRDAAASRS